MNSASLPSSLFLLSPSRLYLPRLQLQPRSDTLCDLGPQFPPLSLTCLFRSRSPLCTRQSSIGVASPSNDRAVSVIDFEDFHEKDWSFLDSEELNSNEEHEQKTGQIISAGEIESTSKVLVAIGSEGFVDRLVDSSPCNLLLIVHDSLLTLASIKGKYDDVKCWHGELINVPEKWAPFDAVFLYFLPALPFKLDQVLGMVAQRCLPDARLVISHPQGREALEQQRKQFPDVIVSDLPDELTLQKVAADHSFEMTEFVDEPGFYLAVLKHRKARSS